MTPERLASLGLYGVALDLETHQIQPGLVSPPIVCGSLARWTGVRVEGEIVDAAGAVEAFRQILADDRLTLTGANIAFDVICEVVACARLLGLDVMPDVLRMYDPTRGAIRGEVLGRVLDVQRFEELHAIARGHLGYDPHTMKKLMDPVTHRPGRYSLRECVKQALGRDDAKVNDRYRCSYALLEGLPIAQWPLEARTYPIDDAVNTHEVALAQAGLLPSHAPHRWPSGGPGSEMRCSRCGAAPGESVACVAPERHLNAHEVSRQTYVHLCMSLGAAWGFHVDQAAVDAIERKYHEEHAGQLEPFQRAGVVRTRGAKEGSVDESVLKKLTAAAYGARAVCTVCQGTGKVPSSATQGRTKINCRACDGSGLDIGAAGVPRTESGEIGIGRDVLRESGDEFLRSFADYDEGKKIPNTYVPFFRGARPPLAGHAADCPSQREGKQRKPCTCPPPYYEVPLVLRPNPLLETGRTSYDGVIQLMPRVGGVRECIVARPGRLFSSEDYKAGEMVTHAQSCIWIVGASRLAEALNRGLDAHLDGAAGILGISYEEAQRRKKSGDKQIVNLRQAYKPANFGFPGRMGAAKLVIQQRKQGPDTPCERGPAWIETGKRDAEARAIKARGFKGLRFCLLMGAADFCGDVKITEYKGRQYQPLCKKCVECAEQLRKSWLSHWPENVEYFEYVRKLDESGAPVVQHCSKRVRGFRHGQVDDDGEPINSGNAIANGYFQGLLADAAKNALMAATRECYDRTEPVRSFTRATSAYEGRESPLYGSRIIVFQHDELIPEHPEELASDAAIRVSEVMVEALRLLCPDLYDACEAEPTLMRRLYKGAEPRWRCECGKVADRRKCECGRADARLIPWEPKR